MVIAQEYIDTPAKTYLFAYPLKRTYAPFLHNTVTRLAGIPRTYEKFESLDVDAFLKLLKAPECGGSAVSMPHKVAIIDHLDGLTDVGREVGAVNTVIIEKDASGKKFYRGHNTDAVGVKESFLKADDTHVKSGKIAPGMIFGAGGAARASVYALNKWLNCSPIYVVNRDDGEVDALIADFKKNSTPTFNPELIHVKTVEQAESLAAPVYIVSAVPSFPPKSPGEILSRQVIENFFAKPEKGVIVEMCYFPHVWTELAQIAQDAGWKVVTGEQPMIWQGIEQQKLWLKCEEKDLPIDDILKTVKAQVEDDTKTGNEPPTK
ncbi:quinate dehydrogenase [Meredithblackwellia eburnea MCA 4105]